MKARKVRRELKDELGKLELKKKGGDIPFNEALEMYLTYLEGRVENGLISASTYENRRNDLRKYSVPINEINITEINRSKIEAIVRGDFNEDLKKNSVATKKNILKYLRQVFEYHLLEFGRIKVNPVTGIYFKNDVRRPAPKIMKPHEVEKLLAYTKEKSPDWYYIYQVAVHTGLRSGELYALRWEDVELENNGLFVRLSHDFKSDTVKPPKNKIERRVPLNTTVKAVLAELKIANPTAEHVLPRKSQWKKGLQAKVLKRFQRECGITQTKFHGLRGFFITTMLRRGMSAIDVMEIVSHQDLKTTMYYVGLAGSELEGTTEAVADIGRSHVPEVANLDEERKKREEKKGS
jgi:integrase